MSQRPSPPRGMRDLLPGEVARRHELLGRILNVYRRFGFQQIETPVVEEIDRLIASEGGENATLVYKILRRGLSDWPAGESDAVDLGLRYDLTVPLARFFATNSNELLLPFKAIQTGPVFRAERPQKGRYRQFTQCDIDILGETSHMAEVELVTATSEALRACEVGPFTIRVNDRRILRTLLSSVGFDEVSHGAVLIALDKLDKIGIEGVHAELRKIEDGPSTKRLVGVVEALGASDGWEATVAALPADVDADAVCGLLDIRNAVASVSDWISLQFDVTIIRGMGYYTGPIFEVQHDAFGGSIAGGGRYDRMIGKLSGTDVPAAGFSIGFERLVHLLEDRKFASDGETKIALLYAKDSIAADVASAAAGLRKHDQVVRTDVAAKNRKAQLERLAAAGFTRWSEVVGSKATEPQALQ